LTLNNVQIAIVTAASPDIASFMADESYLAVSPGKIAYTLPSYLDYNKQLSTKASELNKAGKGDKCDNHAVLNTD